MPAKASKIMIIRHAEKPTGHFAGVNCGLPVDGCEDDVFAQAGGLHLDDVSVGEALLGSGRHGRDDGCDEKDNRYRRQAHGQPPSALNFRPAGATRQANVHLTGS